MFELRIGLLDLGLVNKGFLYFLDYEAVSRLCIFGRVIETLPPICPVREICRADREPFSILFCYLMSFGFSSVIVANCSHLLAKEMV